MKDSKGIEIKIENIDNIESLKLFPSIQEE